jgi:predicted GNAT superfamily acetyltransferase
MRAAEQARDVAQSAGVTVIPVSDVGVLEQVAGLFAQTWGGNGGAGPMNSHILRAMTLAGNYVAGALKEGIGLVGAAAGLIAIGAVGDKEIELHSHVAAVRPELRSGGIGRALKLHQRAWALERGISVVTWTFDPLVRANAVFNVSRLGATPSAYMHNVYGNMADDINGEDESDRLFVRWELESAAVDAAAAGRPLVAGDSEQLPLLLSVSPSGAPRFAHRPPSGRYRVEVPPDISALRRSAPELAVEWRKATRQVLGAVMDGGGTFEIGASGCFVLEAA